MAKTHYSPKTKKIERCSGNCAYGEDTPHFRTTAEGNQWLREKAAKENSAVPEPRSKKFEMTDMLELTNKLAAARELSMEDEGKSVVSDREIKMNNLLERMDTINERLERIENDYGHMHEDDIAGLEKLEEEEDDLKHELQNVEYQYANLEAISDSIREHKKDMKKEADAKEVAKGSPTAGSRSKWASEEQKRHEEYANNDTKLTSSISDAINSGMLNPKKASFMNAGRGHTTGEQVAGWTDDGRKVSFVADFDHKKGVFETTEHDTVEELWTVSITGSTYQPRTRNPDSAGQNIEDLKAVTVFPKGVTAADRDAVVKLWENNHLNAMNAGCAHQEVQYENSKGYKRVDLDNTPKCPHTGYRVGSNWLAKQASPEDVKAGLVAIEKFNKAAGKK